VHTLMAIEIINVTDFGNSNTTTLNATNITGMLEYNNVASTLTPIVDNLGVVIDLGVTDSAVGVTASFVTAATTATADTLDLNLDNCADGGASDVLVTTAVANGFETFNVVSGGDEGVTNSLRYFLQNTGTGLTSFTVNGNRALELGRIPDTTTDPGAVATANNDLKTVDASGFSGDLTLGRGVRVQGTDLYTTFATQDLDKVDGGSGNDTFIFAGSLNSNDFNTTSTEYIDGGDGTDIVQATLGADLATAVNFRSIE